MLDSSTTAALPIPYLDVSRPLICCSIMIAACAMFEISPGTADRTWTSSPSHQIITKILAPAPLASLPHHTTCIFPCLPAPTFIITSSQLMLCVAPHAPPSDAQHPSPRVFPLPRNICSDTRHFSPDPWVLLACALMLCTTSSVYLARHLSPPLRGVIHVWLFLTPIFAKGKQAIAHRRENS